ncbi:4905_t:CDS:1, partial [Racocetra fulgida]
QKKQSSTSRNQINERIVQEDEVSYLMPESDLDSSMLIEIDDDRGESLIYEIGNLEELVTTYFVNNEENEHIEFLAIIELNSEFIKEALLNKINSNNANSQ